VSGPSPWRDGDALCHCGGLYRLADLAKHRQACPTWGDLLAEVDRLRSEAAALVMRWDDRAIEALDEGEPWEAQQVGRCADELRALLEEP